MAEARLRARVPAVDAELAAWVQAEAFRRVCHPRMVVEAGIRLLREASIAAPDLVDLPAAPRGART